MDVIVLGGLVASSLMKGVMPPTPILALFMSRLLGSAILVLSCIIKLPQIVAIVRSKSAEGLSLTGFETELVAYTLTFAYGLHFELPFTGYGEAVIMSVQDVLLLALIYKYSGTPLSHVALFTGVYAGGLGVLLSGKLGDDVMQALSALSFVTIMFARLPQIYANYAAKSTGQLSIFSYIVTVGGGCVRIFTSVTDKAGITMVVGYCISTSMNLTIALQILFYGGAGKAPAAAPKKAKAAAPPAKAAAKAAAKTAKVEDSDSDDSEEEEETTTVRRRRARTRA